MDFSVSINMLATDIYFVIMEICFVLIKTNMMLGALTWTNDLIIDYSFFVA